MGSVHLGKIKPVIALFVVWFKFSIGRKIEV